MFFLENQKPRKGTLAAWYLWAIRNFKFMLTGLQCKFEAGERCDWQNASTNDGFTWVKSSQTSETGR